MARRKQLSSDHPFEDFQPVLWMPPGQSSVQSAEPVYSVRRDHGIGGCYRLHNPRDQINIGRRYLDKVIIEYQIGANHYNLFTIGDFFDVQYRFDPLAAGNIMGDLAERISRRITKFFLKHYSREGYTGGIFGQRFDPHNRNNFLVANTDTYVLKIERYPNMVILKRSGRGKFGYENIKELDGLFDYRFGTQRHILVLESKLERINVNCADLVTNLFVPLRQMFPDALFSYIMFTDTASIYAKKYYDRQRRIKLLPQSIYETLNKHGVRVLFFSFNESRIDFERMKAHLITQYRSIAHLGLELRGRMKLSDKEIVLFDEGETPHMKLVKDSHSGMWREIPLTHKKRR